METERAAPEPTRPDPTKILSDDVTRQLDPDATAVLRPDDATAVLPSGDAGSDATAALPGDGETAVLSTGGHEAAGDHETVVLAESTSGDQRTLVLPSDGEEATERLPEEETAESGGLKPTLVLTDGDSPVRVSPARSGAEDVPDDAPVSSVLPPRAPSFDGAVATPAGGFEDVTVDGADEPPAALPEGLLRRMKADPAHAPEHLALAATERFGPEAAVWIARNRAAYPSVTPHAWAQIVRTQYVRLSRYSGAVAGAAGAFGAVLDVGVLAWNQARMVSHIAAVFGHDPADPDRAAELLVLQGVQKKLDVARTAIEVIRREEHASAIARHLNTTGKTLSILAWQLARMAGMAAAKKVAMKFVPFAGIPLGAMANSSATNGLADKAIVFYGAHALQLPPGQAPRPR